MSGTTVSGMEEKNDWRGRERGRHRQERYEPDGGKTGEMNTHENLHELWHKSLIKSRQEINNERFLKGVGWYFHNNTP